MFCRESSLFGHMNSQQSDDYSGTRPHQELQLNNYCGLINSAAFASSSLSMDTFKMHDNFCMLNPLFDNEFCVPASRDAYPWAVGANFPILTFPSTQPYPLILFLLPPLFQHFLILPSFFISFSPWEAGLRCITPKFNGMRLGTFWCIFNTRNFTFRQNAHQPGHVNLSKELLKIELIKISNTKRHTVTCRRYSV